jgi:hypothetical protein
MDTNEPAPEDSRALVVVDPDISDEVEVDFDFVADNLKDLIAKGKDAIEELLLIAKQSQHPRAFEVVATLLKATADINSDLLAMHKKKSDLRPKDAPHTKGTGPITNNNLFVGSTAELQKMLEDMKKNK